MNEFTHLHCHSVYSIMDAISPIDDMVKAAADMGYGSLALTDHGTMSGAFEFYKACKKHEVNPIIGVEFYCARQSAKEDRSVDNPTDHLLVLAKNEVGFRNLLKLATKSSTDGFHYTPRVDIEMLNEHKEGLICSTACLSGAISKLALGSKVYDKSSREHLEIAANMKDAVEYAGRLKDVFDENSFFLEIMNHESQDDFPDHLNTCRATHYHEMVDMQKKTIEAAYEIAKKIGAPLVATNDVHMVSKEHWQAKDTVFAIRTGDKKDSDERKLTSNSDAFYLKSQAEMCHMFREHASAAQNTMWIAEQCNIDLHLDEHHLPVFDTGGEDLIRYWRKKVQAGFEKKYPPGSTLRNAAVERVKIEIDTIESMGFVSYFLMVGDVIASARHSGIPVGPGRGSAAGSLVSYCLDITLLCPLSHGLLFERFLNSQRVSLPDIDIDFCKERVNEVYKYSQDKYGKDCVARIATFGSLWAKSAIREVAKAHDLPDDEIDLVAKSIHDGQGDFRARIETEITDNEIVKTYYDSYPAWKRAIDEAMILEGCKRSIGKHAAGFVIGDKDLKEYIPLQKSILASGKKSTKGTEDSEVKIDDTDSMLFTQYPMDDLEELGLIKMDYLALETLTVIRRALDFVNKIHGTSITEEQITARLDDSEVYSFLCTGRLLGIFQCESPGLRNLLMQLQPHEFADIVASVALYRPGPMDYEDPETGMSMLETYVLNRNKKKNDANFHWTSLHPTMDSILAETYGVIVYQEQIMTLCRELCGFSLNDADRFRKAVGKKKVELIEAERPGFIRAAQEHGGATEAVATKIFQLIEAFARYGFNKAHAAAYSFLTYQTAWLKRYYPNEYMAAILTSAAQKSDLVDQRKYLEDCMAMGIQVEAPDINKSLVEFVPVGQGRILAGISMIKKINKVATKIVDTRQSGGPFMNFGDALRRLVEAGLNKGNIQALIESGAMDALGDRPSMLSTITSAIPMVARARERRKKHTSILETDTTSITMREPEPLSESVQESVAVDLLGVYIRKPQ